MSHPPAQRHPNADLSFSRLERDVAMCGFDDGCAEEWDETMFDASIAYTVSPAPPVPPVAVEERLSIEAKECPWSLIEAWNRTQWQGIEAAQRAFDDPRVSHWIRVMTRKLWHRWTQDWFRCRFPESEDLTQEVTVKLWARLSDKEGIPLIAVDSRTGPATGYLMKIIERIARDVRNSAHTAGRHEPRLNGIHDEEGRTDLAEGSILDSAGIFADAHESISPEALMDVQRLRHLEVLAAVRIGQEKRREIERFKRRAVAKDYERASFKKSAIYLLVCHGTVPDITLLELAAAERGRGRGLCRGVEETRTLMESFLDRYGQAVLDEHGRPVGGYQVVPVSNTDALKTLVWILDSDEGSFSDWVDASPKQRQTECNSLYRKIGHAKRDIEQCDQ